MTSRSAVFTSKVESAARACSIGDFNRALQLYDDAIIIDPNNHIIYSNRSAILCQLQRYTEAVHDAQRSLQINSTWPKV